MKLDEVEKAATTQYIQNEDAKTNTNVYFWRQVLATMSTMIATIGVGISFAFTGTWLPEVEGEIITKDQGSWLATMNVFSMIFGTCFSWYLKWMLGSRMSLLLISLIWILGWYIVSVSVDFASMVTGCIIIGFASGFNNNIAIDYLIEIPEPRLRGTITVFSTTCSYFGVLLGHLSVIVIPAWRLAMQLCALAPALTIIFIYWSPESPYWLLKSHQTKEARDNFYWLRGRTQESENEFNEILNRCSKQTDDNEKKYNISMKKFTLDFLRPFIVSTLMFTTLSGSGSDIMIIYAIEILNKISSELDGKTMTILMDLICIVFCTLSCYIIKKVNRRTLFFYSCIGEILSLLGIVVALVYSWQTNILIGLLCVYTAVNSGGLNPVVWLVPAEIFPETTRNVGIGASTIYYYFITFIFTKTFPALSDTIKIVSVLWIFIIITSISSILLYFIMPETKDITLEEVEDKMHHENFVSLRWRRGR